jgi:hypothetical protein
MKTTAAVCVLLLCAASVQAQTPVLLDSGQCHWLQPGKLPQQPGVIGHTHIDLDTTDRPRVGGTLRVGFTVTLFHTSAYIGEYYAGIYKTNTAFGWVWDDTGTATPPIMIGDPNGVRTWSGHFSVIPDIPHGWEWISMSLYTHFADRTSVVMLNEPIYSVIDVSKPSPNDTDPAVQRPQAVCRISPPVLADGSNDTTAPFYGEQTVQFDSAFPRDVISTYTPMTGSSYGYGQRGMLPAILEERLDMDLHHGIDGTLLFTGIEFDANNGLIHAPMNIDPAVIGPGAHKLAVRRTQTNGDEMSAVLLVTHITIDPNAPAPPPVVCTLPGVLVNGQCVMPPPPPPPPALTVVKIQMCAIETLSDGSIKNRCLDLP